jgi:Tfp pilus assembly protein PilO
MNKIIFSQNEKKLLVVLATSFFLAAGIFKVYLPLKHQVNMIEDKAAARKEKFNKMLLVINEAKSLERYREMIKPFTQSLSDEQQLAAILNDVEAAGQAVNVRISMVRPREIQKKDSYNVFSVALDVSGPLKNTLQFIHLVEGAPYFCKAEELSLETAGNEEVRGELVLNRIMFP